MRVTHLSEIRSRIQKAEPGAVFIPSDFFDVAEPVKVNMCLKRLKDSGELQPIIRGVFAKPRFSQFLNTLVPPRTEDVARAIARNHGWSIAPSGDTALNLLGLSTQVPAGHYYVSDGPYRAYQGDGMTITFKHTNHHHELTNVSSDTALLIQGLRANGKDGLRAQDVHRLSKQFTAEQKKRFLAESQRTTQWIRQQVTEICKEAL